MINETKYRTLQDIYLISRSPDILAEMYREAKNIAHSITVYKAKNKVNYEETSHNSAIRFIEMYLKNPLWFSTSPAKRIGHDVLYCLYDYKQKKLDLETPYPPNLSVPPRPIKEDTRWVIEEIEEDSPRWKEILFDVYKAKTFKEAMLKLDTYLPRSWIYAHAKRLQILYRNTRR